LADLSAMMFPSADPFAYPNQTAAPAQTYDNLLKNLGDDPSFPFPASLDELRMQRHAGSDAFVPPSSTFIFNSDDSLDKNLSPDNDVQLLGPMPAYMMQGGVAPQASRMNGGGTRFQQMQQQYPEQNQSQIYGNFPANVDLDQLLGGEEWVGSVGLSNMGSMLGPTGAFTGKMGGGSSLVNDNSQERVSFDDLNPGSLGWNLDGY